MRFVDGWQPLATVIVKNKHKKVEDASCRRLQEIFVLKIDTVASSNELFRPDLVPSVGRDV
jgi:hypothetical protein